MSVRSFPISVRGRALAHLAAALLATIPLLAASSAMAQLLLVEGRATADWDSEMFPHQSFDVPIDGLWSIQPYGAKRVRIVGSYAYEADISWHPPYGWLPSGYLLPYPFEVEGDVDLIATIGVENGRTVYRAPTGSVAETITIGALGIDFTRQHRNVRLDDLHIERGRFGIGTVWFVDSPLELPTTGEPTSLLFQGRVAGP